MTILEVRPSKKFKGAWEAFEGPGVSPAFSPPDARRKAIDYASNRFGGRSGEIRVHDDVGLRIEQVITILDSGQYGRQRAGSAADDP